MSSGPILPPVNAPSGIVHVTPDDTLWQIFRRPDSDQPTIPRTLPDHTALPDVQISQADYDAYRQSNPQLGLPALGDSASTAADAEPAPASSETESRHIAHAGHWTATTIEPDWCEVEGEPIPFDSHAEITAPARASPNVKARGTPVYAITHLHRGIQGDAGAGLVSTTSGETGYTQILTGQNNVKVNGLPVGRNDSLALINCNANDCGGALGQLHTAI